MPGSPMKYLPGLSTRKLQPEENLEEYSQVIESLSKNCNYRDVTAVKNREDAIRNTLIGDAD